MWSAEDVSAPAAVVTASEDGEGEGAGLVIADVRKDVGLEVGNVSLCWFCCDKSFCVK